MIPNICLTIVLVNVLSAIISIIDFGQVSRQGKMFKITYPTVSNFFESIGSTETIIWGDIIGEKMGHVLF